MNRIDVRPKGLDLNQVIEWENKTIDANCRRNSFQHNTILTIGDCKQPDTFNAYEIKAIAEKIIEKLSEIINSQEDLLFKWTLTLKEGDAQEKACLYEDLNTVFIQYGMWNHEISRIDGDHESIRAYECESKTDDELSDDDSGEDDLQLSAVQQTSNPPTSDSQCHKAGHRLPVFQTSASNNPIKPKPMRRAVSDPTKQSGKRKSKTIYSIPSSTNYAQQVTDYIHTALKRQDEKKEN